VGVPPTMLPSEVGETSPLSKTRETVSSRQAQVARTRRDEMPKDDLIIRIEIAEGWSASEFSELFSQFDYLYQIARFSEVQISGQTSQPFGFWSFRNRAQNPPDAFFPDALMPVELALEAEGLLRRRQVEHLIDVMLTTSDKLEVRRIEYASPGFIDLVGAGRVAREVRVFLLGIIDRFIHSKDRKIAREAATQDIIAKKIKNAENLVKLGDKVGLDPETRQILVREVMSLDYYIEGRLLSHRITAVK
jgi:hypothetical protein